MHIELCVWNYTTCDVSLVNGWNEVFKLTTMYSTKMIIWITFSNFNMKKTKVQKFNHLYTKGIIIWMLDNYTSSRERNKNWKIQSHVIPQKPIPFAIGIARTIHKYQGLSSDELFFNPRNVTKHGFMIYTTLFHISFIKFSMQWKFQC